jgi:hypothetical protein
MIAGVHLEFLAQSSLRVSVFVQWVWTYVTGQRGSQIILNSRPSEQARRTQNFCAAIVRIDNPAICLAKLHHIILFEVSITGHKTNNFTYPNPGM